jgi:hypothetical protein
MTAATPKKDPLADDLEDLLDDLPPLQGSLDEDEELGTGEDFEPKLSTLSSDENVGLDDDVAGMDFDPVQLLDLGEESETWTKGSEAAGDEIGTDGLESTASEEEYGWTEGTEASPLEDWADDLDLGQSEKVLGEDTGEEGVEDEVSLGGGAGDDDVGLPPLEDFGDDDGMETLADDLDLADDALIEGDELSYEEEARLSGTIVPARLDASVMEVAHLGPRDGMIYDVSVVTDGFLAVGEDLYRLRGDEVSPIAGPLAGIEELRPTSIAAGDDEGRLIAIGTRLSGVLVSHDGGQTFEPRNGWRGERDDAGPQKGSSVGFFVVAERHEGGRRLWGRTRSGALFRSDDFGETWSRPLLLAPAFALADDPEGGFLALSVPASGPAQTARTEDGGHGWTMRTVPGLTRSADSEAEYHIAARGPRIVVASDGEPHGPRISDDDGQSWQEVATLPATGVTALVREGDALCLYASLFFAGADRGVLIRHARRPDGTTEDRLVLDVRAEREARELESAGDPEGDNRIFAIHARTEAGHTILVVATGAGLFRVRVRHP